MTLNEPPRGKQRGICCNYFLIAASGGELTQAPQPPSPSPEGEGEQEVRKLNKSRLPF
jgi:hypothetical protein